MPLLAIAAAAPAVAATLPAAAGAATAANSQPDTGNWTTGGSASAVTRVGQRVYVGGEFDSVGPRTGPFASVDASSGAVVGDLPYVDGNTGATIPDGAGGWYVGGAFERIGGVAVDNLAHVTADGEVDLAFRPQVDGVVAALALAPDGATLYAAGGFDTVEGVERPGAAALDTATGALRTGWNARLSDDVPVVAIAADAASVYLGGAFVEAGGQPRTNLAQLDAADGDATAWAPAVDGAVMELLLADDTLYAAGPFYVVDTEPLSYVASFDASGATPALNTAFAPLPDGEVHSIAVDDGTVYLAGLFSSAGGQSRVGVAAADPATGAALAGWDAALDGAGLPVEVDAVAVAGDHVYLGGRFASVHGEARTNLAQVSTADGLPTDWNPVAGRGVKALAAHAGGVVTSGTLDTVGGVPRRNLAAFDAADGSVTAWDPGADNPVFELASGPDGTIYASGLFSTIGGQSRVFLAALDPVTGTATGWDPQVGVVAVSLAAHDDTVFLGGEFNAVGPDAQPRDKLAALSATTGAVLPWRADVGGGVPISMATHGSTLYVAGPFIEDVGGVRRDTLAAVDADSGAVLPWNPLGGLPTTDGGVVHAIAVDGDRLVAGGSFEQVDDGSGPHPRGRVAVYDLSGSLPVLTPADARADGLVEQVGIHGDVVYVAGELTALGDEPRDGAGAFDATSGATLGWAPQQLVAERLRVADDGTVYATGAVASDGRQGAVGSFSVAPATLVAPEIVQTGPSTVVCDRGSWEGSRPLEIAFSWSRDGAALPEATAELPATAREGLGCTVTARNRGGTTAATVNVPHPPPPAPPAGVPSPPPAAVGAPPPRRTRAGLRALPGTATVRRGVATLRLRCGGTSGRCAGTLRLTTRVRVPAAARRRAASGRPRRRTRTLLVGSTRYAIPAGASATVRIRLTRAGLKRLLAKPRGRMGVTARASGGRERTLVLRAATPPRRRR